MKKGKTQGPDDISVEAWIALGNKGVEFLVNFFNRLLRGEKMTDEWKRRVFVPLYKGKRDIKEYGNYRGIKLMSHSIKLWDWIIEARISKGDRQATIWVDARKEYHRRNSLSKNAVGKVN